MKFTANEELKNIINHDNKGRYKKAETVEH